ncbi:MAG: T9SS type A sorting domain-containing protein [Bacteroidota bacterium]
MRKIAFTCVFLINLCNQCFAQGVYNNGGTIVINTGTSIYIDGDDDGDYLNETGISDGKIDINGDMVIEGDWRNNASNTVFINPGIDGTVTMQGITPQYIGGTGTTSFENLTINNTYSGVGIPVDLGSNITVGSTLTLTDGVVRTGSNYLILTSTNATDMSGSSDTSYIFGNIRRYIDTNTDTYIFPTGNGTTPANFHKVELINRSLAGVTYIDAKFASLANHNDIDMVATEEGKSYTSFSTDGVWYLVPDDEPTGGKYDLRCYINDFSSLTDNQYAILKRSGSSTTAEDWNCPPCGYGDPGINLDGQEGRILAYDYALRRGLSDFSQFGIGKTGAPLPVELLSFSAVCDEQDISLIWVTATETNNDYFTVQKALTFPKFETLEKLEWENVTTVPGAGNSNTIQHYQFADNSSVSSKKGVGHEFYYRLKQTDYNGKSTYSEVVVVECGYVQDDEVNIFSSDFNNILIKVKTGKDKNYYITLYDAVGREMLNDVMYAKKGESVHFLNACKLAAGIYLVTFENSREYLTKKVTLK